MSATDIKRLITLLDHERQALQRADIARLERLLPRKSALLARLEQAEPEESPLLVQLRQAAATNGRLFEALIRGLREARAMIEGLATGGHGMTYGRDGARALLDPPTGALHRRA
jgi:flagellar biosynthesis/type III secretory pathway chaperone